MTRIAHAALLVIALLTAGCATLAGRTQEFPHGAGLVMNPVFDATGSRLLAAVSYSPSGDPVTPRDGPFLWNVETGAPIARIDLLGWSDAIDFSPDGARIVMAGRETHRIHVFDGRTGQEIESIPNEAPGAVLAISPDASRLIVAQDGGAIAVWDVRANRQLFTTQSPGENILGAEFAAGGASLLTRHFPETGGQTARLWDIATGRRLAEFSPLHLQSAAVTPDGSRIITTTVDGVGGIWDARTGAQIAPFAGHTWNYGLRGYVTARGQFSPDGSRYLARGDDGVLHAWDTRTGAALVRFDIDEIGGVYSPDGSRIATHSGLHISLWDAESGALLGETQLRGGGTPPLVGILEMTFGHGGQRIYASSGGRLVEWRISAITRRRH